MVLEFRVAKMLRSLTQLFCGLFFQGRPGPPGPPGPKVSLSIDDQERDIF